MLLNASFSFADELKLQGLIDEALKNNPEILAAGERVEASKQKVPQARSLPDPMFSVGYQNEGFEKYTYGYESGAQWSFSASQTFPYPGKLALRGEAAEKEHESLGKAVHSIRFRIIMKIKELFYELFLAYKNLDIIRDRASFLVKVEDAALARYSSGMSQVQDVVMAQTEKYMLIEKEEMLKQKIQSMEAQINTVIGRDVNAPVGRPVEPQSTVYSRSIDEVLKMSYENSPEIRSREKTIAASEKKIQLAKKDSAPDFTLNAGYGARRGPFKDMWSLTTSFNIPLYQGTKQRPAVLEAEASLREIRHELDSMKLLIASAIRENYSMMKTTEKLMELYRNGLIPKTYQDFELALSGYVTGKSDAAAVITRLKALIDFDLLYWGQFVEREKAIARIAATAGIMDAGPEDKTK